MTKLDKHAKSDEPTTFGPGLGAYVGLVLATGALLGIGRLLLMAINRYGQAMWFGGPRWAYVAVELLLCLVAWFYIADHLLRHYDVDASGLTVHRLVLPSIRIPWERVTGFQIYGYGESFLLKVAGAGSLLVMLECLSQGSKLAGIIQHRAGWRGG